MEQTVNYLSIGTFLTLRGETYEIIRHNIEVSESGISTLSLLLPVSAETGEDLGKDPIAVNLDMYDYIVH